MKKLCCSSDQNKDIISYLPDPIRSHIVSSLPMKDALRTKILSRRWRNVCSSLSTMEFIQYEFEKSKCDFRDLVDETLILHDGSDIRKFCISVTIDDAYIHSRRANTWIYFALQHNVQHLRLGLHTTSTVKLLKLPCCLFTCSTLSFLSLSCRYLEWPTSIKFPTLKHFHLEGVKFYDENVTSKLFSSCTFPVLEKLLIEYCKFDSSGTLSISFTSLKFLQLIWENDRMVNLSITSIGDIDYQCFSPPNMSCECLLSLLSASFQFPVPETITNESTFYTSVRKILIGLHNVNSLSLSEGLIESIGRDPDVLAHLPGSYCNLKDLYLDIWPTENYVKVIYFLLRIYPNLQMLYISVDTLENYEENWTCSNMINLEKYLQSDKLSPGDNLKHLKRVEIRDFGGSANELDMARHVLESASNLEKFDIRYSCEIKHDAEKLMKIDEKLSLFHKVSSSAEIVFSYNESPSCRFWELFQQLLNKRKRKTV